MKIDKIYRLTKDLSIETEDTMSGRRIIIRHKGFKESIPIHQDQIAEIKKILSDEFPEK